MFEPKGGREVIEPSTTPDVLPLGQKPEGELNSLLRMQNAFNKLKDENKRLKDALGITETIEPLVLTSDMEIKNGHQ